MTVLSTTLADGHDDRIELVRDLDEAIELFNSRGQRAVYLDGASTIQGCLAGGLVDELTISQVRVLISAGISLFGVLPHDIELHHRHTRVLNGGMLQTTYRVNHP